MERNEGNYDYPENILVVTTNIKNKSCNSIAGQAILSHDLEHHYHFNNEKYNPSLFFLRTAGIIFYSPEQCAHVKGKIQGYLNVKSPDSSSANHLMVMHMGPLDLVCHWFVIQNYMYDLE